ncbi:cell division cycle protein 20 homolog [Condylostylus longicornis]|uniref:cell division cycle protein 20 homolog n=1 Tax=Condylostylus longicornis TaxID=2530218 RepID=UPI00244DC1AE|nr:cell division cycle protein 20 homolog [Condylostylus longicornis]
MSQFNFINDLNSIVTMEGDLTKGPAPRWKNKVNASSISNASINLSTLSISQTQNNANVSSIQIVGNSKTPGKLRTKTPSKVTKTPTAGDRFIPNRGATNFEIGHYLVKQENQNSEEENETGASSFSKAERQKLISETLQVGDIKTQKILSYQNKAPAAPESHQNPLKVVYSIKTPISSKSGSRYIPTTSERILDAPDIINDYYLNLMDWSCDNIVTVALGNAVYLWNAGTGNIEQLVEYDEGDNACSLAWIQDGHILAIGNNNGAVELWDCSKVKRLRVMEGHTARVGSLAWNSYICTSGSRDGSIIHHDVRQRDHNILTLRSHTQEVCGLKWSVDFKYLSSGGNDNIVNIWSTATEGSVTGSEPLYTFNQHQAAVRALAWCPWIPNILATGGGTADRHIKFWNVSNGCLINSVDTKSQVCSLLWSKNYKELISAHGYANNQLTIWKYPSMIKQAELTGHTSRILQMAMSPDGSTVISAGADETLRLWNCFALDPNQAKKEKFASTKVKQSVFKQSIR